MMKLKYTKSAAKNTFFCDLGWKKEGRNVTLRSACEKNEQKKY